jgi:hypothetical protein
MATLRDLIDRGELHEHDGALEPGEMPVRYVYFSPDFQKWYSTVLPSEPRDRSRREFPFDQVETKFYEFILGRPLVYDHDRKKLDPIGHHVWELKTPDVRIFGWFAKKGHFVAVCGEMKNRLLNNKNYDQFVQKCVEFRDSLDLDPPKSISGVKADDVL